VGEPGAFRRTYNRRDYALEPFGETVLDRLVRNGVPVIGVGKIGDIFAGRGLSESIHTEGNEDCMRLTTELARTRAGGCFVFVNLVDFDMLYGHRRDARGYRRALEQFDADYRGLARELAADDLVLLTADHGNDPTFEKTTDHTREYVPLLVDGAGVRPGSALGTRTSFADIGATVEEALGFAPVGSGQSCLPQLLR